MKLCLLVFLFVAAVTLVHAQNDCPEGFWSSGKTCSRERPCDGDNMCFKRKCCKWAFCPPGYFPSNVQCDHNKMCGPGSHCGENRHCCIAPPPCRKGYVGTRKRPTCNRDVQCLRPFDCKKGRCCRRLPDAQD